MSRIRRSRGGGNLLRQALHASGHKRSTRSPLRRSSTRGLSYSLAGAAALAALILLLPLLGTTAELPPAVRIVAYALVLIPIPLLLHGLIVASGDYATSQLLILGAVSAAIGFSSALVARPEYLADGPGFLVLLALCVADLARILAAVCVGISLARYITSVGTVLIVVVAAIAADVFSVFAGPTEALVRANSPLLDFLLLVFPTFGSPLGFGLGLSDFIFLAFFAAASRFLDLRYAATLLGVSTLPLVACQHATPCGLRLSARLLRRLVSFCRSGLAPQRVRNRRSRPTLVATLRDDYLKA